MKPPRDLDGKITKGMRMTSQARRQDVCWPWLGARAGVTPVIRLGSTTKSVRKVLWEAELGPIVNDERVRGGACGNLLCINPYHATLTSPLAMPMPEPSSGIDQDVEDCVDLILSLEDDERTLPDILAQGWPYDTSTFETALARIASEGL